MDDRKAPRPPRSRRPTDAPADTGGDALPHGDLPATRKPRRPAAKPPSALFMEPNIPAAREPDHGPGENATDRLPRPDTTRPTGTDARPTGTDAGLGSADVAGAANTGSTVPSRQRGRRAVAPTPRSPATTRTGAPAGRGADGDPTADVTPAAAAVAPGVDVQPPSGDTRQPTKITKGTKAAKTSNATRATGATRPAKVTKVTKTTGESAPSKRATASPSTPADTLAETDRPDTGSGAAEAPGAGRQGTLSEAAGSAEAPGAGRQGTVFEAAESAEAPGATATPAVSPPAKAAKPAKVAKRTPRPRTTGAATSAATGPEPAAPVGDPAPEQASPAGSTPGTAELDVQPTTYRPAGAGSGPTPELLLRQLRDRPQHAPETLALAVVDRFGPEARDQVSWLRANYPGVTDDALARYLVHRFSRPRHLSPIGGLGTASVLADAARLATAQARLALHLAAVYGLEPTHPDRAAELLMLAGAHPDRPSARLALAAIQHATPTGDRDPDDDHVSVSRSDSGFHRDRDLDHNHDSVSRSDSGSGSHHDQDGSSGAGTPDNGSTATDAAGAGGSARPDVLVTRMSPVSRLSRLAALPLGGRLVARLAGRLLPGAGPLLTTVLNTRSMHDFAIRALAEYQPIRAGGPGRPPVTGERSAG